MHSIDPRKDRMRGLKTFVTTLAAAGLLVSAAPASGHSPAGGHTPAYRHYVGCGLSRKAKPSHVCPRESKKGAFFKSLKGDVTYSICVKFPSGKDLCAHKQEAQQGTLYVNKITSTIPGKHRVTWFVEGKKVGSFAFTVKG
jgi:hypothetical protein